MTMHEGLVDQTAKFKKRIASEDTSSYKVIERGQLVVGFPIDEGVLDFQLKYECAVVSPAYGVWALVDDSAVERSYLQRFLRSPMALSYYRSKLRGSTARRRSLPAEVFLALPVPLPPVEEQRRIARILTQADALRAQRRESIARLDDLLASFFIGSLHAAGGRQVSLREAGVDFEVGKNVVGTETDAHPQHRVIKVSAVSRGSFDPTESKPLPRAYNPPASHRIRPGDILFGRASGSLELLGATVQVDDVPDEMFLPDKVWRAVVRRDGIITAGYLLGVLRSRRFKAFVRHNSSGAAGVRNIGKSKVLEYELVLPSPDAQKSYERHASKVSTLQRTQQLQAEKLEQLFASLQARAFAGRL